MPLHCGRKPEYNAAMQIPQRKAQAKVDSNPIFVMWGNNADNPTTVLHIKIINCLKTTSVSEWKQQEMRKTTKILAYSVSHRTKILLFLFFLQLVAATGAVCEILQLWRIIVKWCTVFVHWQECEQPHFFDSAEEAQSKSKEHAELEGPVHLS